MSTIENDILKLVRKKREKGRERERESTLGIK
jgi:hypothetical protein